VASGKLNVDLGERVPDAVALVDQTVVNTDSVENDRGDDREEDQK
jgi:hypothetical protein